MKKSNAPCGIYSAVQHLGLSLAEWAGLFHNEFTPFELYRMIGEGANLRKMYAGTM